MIKAIIFDFDGVLVESADIKTSAFAKLFEGEESGSVEKIIKYHLEHAGVSRFEKLKYIYKNILHRKLSEETFKNLCQRFSKLVKGEVITAPYIKGAEVFLNNYAAGYKCFVSSATPQAEIEDIIKKRNMSQYFSAVFGAPKQKTDIVKEIICTYRLYPKEAVYIGDALTDYEAAIAHNIHFIARISNNGFLFKDIDCRKARDLINLEGILKTIGEDNPKL
jgi:HAD superfamily hydrolase (TIGR01549 family)